MVICPCKLSSCVSATPVVVGGRYGLGSKDVTPAQFLAVYANLTLDKPKNHFTLGIVDDVTNTSLEVGEEVNVTGDDGTILFYNGE